MQKNTISGLIEKIRKEDLFPLSRPLSKASFVQLKEIMRAKGFPAPDDQMFELFRFTDGLAYNGIELFSVIPGAFREGNYTLPGFFTSNKSFRDYYSNYESYKASFIYVGRTDEDLLIFDSETGEYMICAREDLMTYEVTFDFEDFIGIIFKGRI